MEGQAKLIQNQSIYFKKGLGDYYNYFKDQVAVLKGVICLV
jgi:hypothetical protein